MFVHWPGTEFQTIEKFTFEQYGDQHLLQPVAVAGELNRVPCEFLVTRSLGLRRLALQDTLELLVDGR